MNTERTPYDDEEREVSQMESPTPMFHAPAMTNYEQRIILAWLEAERERLLDAEKTHLDETGDWLAADRIVSEYRVVERQIAHVAALNTTRPALTEDERKAQAAGIMGKMGNGVA